MKIVGAAAPPQEQQASRSAGAAVPAVQPLKNAAVAAATAKATVAAVSSKAPVLPAALGLPVDGLSAAIVSFAKFFSLPLDTLHLTRIRRQVLAALPGQPVAAGAAPATGESGAAASREALAVAATAAAAKGVELTADALEKYAAAIEPETAAAVDPDAHQGSNGHSPGGSGGQDRHNGGQKQAGQNPLLAVMNRLPGQDGRRWVVLPFSVADDGGGGQYRVSVRILLDENAPANRSDKLAVDIAKSGNGSSGGERWLFVLDSANGQKPRLEVFVQPPRPAKTLAMLRAGISTAMGLALEQVAVANQAGRFAVAAECCAGLPGSVDEEA